MKILVVSIIVGFVFLYFFNMAVFKVPLLNLMWSIHAGIRFLAGFLLLGVSYFYAKALTFKTALYITVSIIAVDYIYDYYMQDYRLNFEIILHGIYMLVWGATLGYLTARHIDRSRA
ncbi:hypothetical protein [Methylomonas sp. AM2-LC]|uniref:hypothetical protein n=1 Tax=Methylomonas sp. AM2-LC TaxID=3153301 RepID=UPI00326611D4